MTRRTRWFLVGSALIVMFVLCTGLVAYYNGNLPGLMSSGPGPAELAYIPESATVVAYANVADIMKSDLRKHLQQVLPTGQGKNEFQAETGIDLEKDIDSVVAGFGVTASTVAAGSAAQAAMDAASKTVVLIRGRLDRAKLEAQAKEHGGTTEEYKGKTLLEFQDANATGSAHVAGTFLEPGLVAVGTIDEVRAAIDAHDSGHNIRKNADVMKFVSSVDPLSNAWVTGRVEGLAKTASLPAEARDRLSAIQWFGVTARIDKGLSGVLHAQARDDQSGEDLRSVVRGGLAAARLVGGQNPKLDIAMNSMQVSGTGKDLAVTFTVPPEIFDIANGVAGLRNLGKR
jgi:hypothetical protein